MSKTNATRPTGYHNTSRCNELFIAEGTSAIGTGCIPHLIVNVDVNVLYTAVTTLSVFIHLESIKIHAFL